jgi:hypothetical protein
MNAARQSPQSASVRFPLRPRLVPPAKVARWLFLSVDDFRTLLPKLRLEGFPAPCPVTGHYDLLALEAWQDKRSGLAGAIAPTTGSEATIRQRLDALG